VSNHSKEYVIYNGSSTKIMDLLKTDLINIDLSKFNLSIHNMNDLHSHLLFVSKRYIRKTIIFMYEMKKCLYILMLII